MRNYEFHTVLDAFGGTRMVSYLFKRMGKRVTYNDLFHRKNLEMRTRDVVRGFGNKAIGRKPSKN